MKLKKTTFQISYLGATQTDGLYREKLRTEWPCMMVPGSQFCLHKSPCMILEALQPDTLWTISHVPSGLSVRGEIPYAEARIVIERLESANIPNINVDGDHVQPEGVLNLVRDAMRAL